VLATTADWQQLLDDLAAALTQSVSKDGQTVLTGNLPMGGNVLTGLGAGSAVGQSLRWEQLFSQGTETDIASAATVDIGAQNSNFLRVTGTTTITSFGTNYRGPRFLRFAGAVTLTNGANLILQGGANYTTTAGDILIAIPKATLGVADGWCVVIPALIPNGSITTEKIADNAITSAKIAAGAVLPVDLANGGQELGPRNRIINGDMRIDQRNAGASVTITNTAATTYVLDRWAAYGSNASRFSVQQNAGAVTPPTGFRNYIGATSLSAYSVGSSENFTLSQNIEGFNVADLGWGTASAQAVTLSFWVRSSLTGTFGGSVINSAINRSYPFSYTVSAANTWEQKTITIAGDTSGTWVTDNGIGIRLSFGLGVGSTLSTTAGSWASGFFISATGATSVVGTNGATFYITGVQLEAGTVATPFERRPYGTELALCHRYCQNIRAAESNGFYLRYAYGECVTSTGFSANVNLFTPMRTVPSLTVNTASLYSVYSRVTLVACTAVTINGDGSSPSIGGVNTTVSSGLTQGSAGALMSNNNITSYLLFTAEL
jgi:hypothetical protein